MNSDFIQRIVDLQDERNYLRNLLEAAEETGKDIEDVINDRIDDIYQELAIAEAE